MTPGNHWTFFVVNFADESFDYFDSFHGDAPVPFLGELRQWVGLRLGVVAASMWPLRVFRTGVQVTCEE